MLEHQFNGLFSILCFIIACLLFYIGVLYEAFILFLFSILFLTLFVGCFYSFLAGREEFYRRIKKRGLHNALRK